MRLPLLASDSLSAEQKSLYDDMVAVIEKNFGQLVARRKDGALIGPLNGWLHFPQFGRPAWAFNKALVEHSVLPSTIQQTVTLVTAAKFGARYEVYGREYFARAPDWPKTRSRLLRPGSVPTTSHATRASPRIRRPR